MGHLKNGKTTQGLFLGKPELSGSFNGVEDLMNAQRF